MSAFRVQADRRRLNGRAFTLIEVLVVAGVITLLIAILVPSLARSREQARSAICQGNLRTLGQAMYMYTEAHRGTLPFEDRPDPTRDVPGDRGDKTGWLCWFDVIDRYLTGAKSVAADKSAKVCPTVHKSDPQLIESYRMNSKLAEDNIKSEYYYPFRKLDTLAKRTAQTVLLFDGDVGGVQLSFKGRWRLTQNDDVNYRHNRMTNILFCDFHVETLHKRVLKNKSYNEEMYKRNQLDPYGSVFWLPPAPPDLGPWDPDPTKPE